MLNKTIIIGTEHDGHDPGAIGIVGMLEKNLNFREYLKPMSIENKPPRHTNV